MTFIRRPDRQEEHEYTGHMCTEACYRVREHATLPYVYRFATLMEYKFSLNRSKGDRAGWMKMSVREILNKLIRELAEAEEAFANLEANDHPDPEIEEVLRYRLALELADVANYCLEGADRVGGLDDLDAVLAGSFD